MKKGLICIVILISFVLYGSPAHEVEWAWKAKRPQRIQDVFSHEVHKKVLQKEGFGCSTCHTMGVEIKDEKVADEMMKVSHASFFPGKETCHFCHYNPKAGNIGPDKCSICHSNVRDIQPANHNFDWISKHSVYSKGDPSNCESCHSPKFCEDCHKRRDVLPTQRYHDTNYIFVHPIDARADPSRCGQCHELGSFCDTCHREGGYEK